MRRKFLVGLCARAYSDFWFGGIADGGDSAGVRTRSLEMLKNLGRLAGLAAMCVSTAAVADPFTFNKVVDTGVAVPGGLAGNFTAVNIVGVDTGGIAFTGNYTYGGQNYSGLYRINSSQQITPIADRWTSAPGMGVPFDSIVATENFDPGATIFAASTSQGQGLFRWTTGGMNLVIKQGDALPDGAFTLGTFEPRGVSGDANEVAFGCTRSDGSRALYVTVGGQPVRLVDDTVRSPVFETGFFVDFPEVAYRNGTTLFVGRAIDLDAPVPLVEPAGLFTMTPGNPIRTMVGKRERVPSGGDDDRFNEFERPRIDSLGRYCFAGGFVDEVNPGSTARLMGVFALDADDGSYKEYVTSAMALPGLHADTFEFTRYSFENGVTVFGPQDVDGKDYIYVERDGILTYVISAYDTLDGKSIASMRLAMDNTIDGVVSFRAVFNDGSSGIYSFAVPEPACLGLVGVGLLLFHRRQRAIV